MLLVWVNCRTAINLPDRQPESRLDAHLPTVHSWAARAVEPTPPTEDRNLAGDPPQPAYAFLCATHLAQLPLGRKLAGRCLWWALRPRPLLGRTILVRRPVVN